MLKGYFQYIVSFSKKSIGLLLFLICSYAIYNQVFSNDNSIQYQSILHQLIFKIPLNQWFVLLLLMISNFLIESIKWRLVVSSNNSISILKAVKGVLVGQTFAFFTPNRIGEYAGRTLYLEEGKKLMGVYFWRVLLIANSIILIFVILHFYIQKFSYMFLLWLHLIF